RTPRMVSGAGPGCGSSFTKLFVPYAVRQSCALAAPLNEGASMKKLLVTSLLAFAAYGFSQDTQGTAPAQTTTGQTTAAGQQTSTGQQAAAQPQQKTIKDPAEYNAYMSAISATDPNAKAQALEAFLQQYPNTVVKEETLEQLMAAYQAAGNAAKMSDAGQRLLQVNPNNIRALALLTFVTRSQAAQSTPQQAPQLYGQAA